MPKNLRQALRTFLRYWQDDLSPEWQEVLKDVSPAFDAVREDLLLEDKEKIFPGRKGTALPGAPADASVFRALEVLSPNDVKVVVIGQDPYPNIARATGRAFDQGNLTSWLNNGGFEVATSLEALAQVTAHFRTDDARYLDTEGWSNVQADLAANRLKLQAPRKLFDYWENQGVLFLNAALTISAYKRGGSPAQVFGHLPLWEPVINQIIRSLVTRQNRKVVFLTWGSFAKKVLTSSGAKKLPQWNVQATAAEKRHPSVVEFLELPNAFTEANAALAKIGEQPIKW